MEPFKFTKTRLDSLTPPLKSQAFVWDVELKGFGLRITSTGVKSFVLQRRIDGREYRISLGRLGDITVEQARRLAQTKVGEIAHGKNPVLDQKARLEANARKKTASDLTLGKLMNAYCDHLITRGASSAKNVRADIDRNLHQKYPDLSARAANEISRSDLAAVLRELSEAGKGRTAGKLRSYFLAAYNLAISAESDSTVPSSLLAFQLTSNPAAQLKAPAIQLRHRVLSKSELSGFLAHLDRYTSAASDLVLCALLLGGQRPTQLGRVEITSLDIASGSLTLLDKKGRRSQPRQHVLPLTGTAVPLFSRLAQESAQKNSRYLFSVTGTNPVGIEAASHVVAAISKAMIKDGSAGQPFTLSDLRRTAETMLASVGVDKDTRAQLLSHGLGGVQGQRYDRHSYFNEKQAALLKWDLHLQTLRKLTID